MDWQKLFDEIKTIAVVGYSDDSKRAGHYVPEYLARVGYEIIAVNPKYGDMVDGFPCYPTLTAIPEGTALDVIDVFRTPSAVPGVAEEALRLNPLPKYFWMQPGAENESAAQLCADNGVTPILGACMLAEHKRLRSA
jgi:predicted CoA-binding protein